MEELTPSEVKHSRFIACVLRHHPERAGIRLDPHGWADIDALIAGCCAHSHTIDRQILDRIVRLNNKRRFAYSEDGTKIRARQGHSVDVDIELRRVTPPDVLYHGTIDANTASIRAKGLLPMTRLYVHLSRDVETARIVGARRKGKVVIYAVDAAKMAEDGFAFFLSENGVWLTKQVPPRYLRQMAQG